MTLIGRLGTVKHRGGAIVALDEDPSKSRCSGSSGALRWHHGDIDRPRLLVLCPLEPRRTGNGLAMRTAQCIEAVRHDYDVVAVVVPVSGRPPGQVPWSSEQVRVLVADVEDRGERAGIRSLMADPALRMLLFELSPLPRAARAAWAGLADSIVTQLSVHDDPRPAGGALHVVRSYLAPLGLALRRRLDLGPITLDLDDDDEAFARATGDEEDAEAYRRLVGSVVPHFDRVAMASSRDALALSVRLGIDAPELLPNAIDVPPSPRRRAVMPPALLFVGNLTFAPNVAAARELATAIVPALRAAAEREFQVWLVGPHTPGGEVASLATLPGVEVFGFVEDLSAFYEQATAMVAPLRTGSGTKIKVLESFARLLPVVTSPAGAAGLEVSNRVHLLVGQRNEDIVEHVAALLESPELGRRLAAHAYDYVNTHHRSDVVAALVRRFLGGSEQDRSVSE